jgi:hypothetical protein
MIRKSGHRFSDQIMLKERDSASERRRPLREMPGRFMQMLGNIPLFFSA